MDSLYKLIIQENLKVKQNFLLPFQISYVLLGGIYTYVYTHFGFHLASQATLTCSILTTFLSIWGYKQKDIWKYQIVANINIGLYLITLSITAYDTGGITSSAGFWLPSVVLLAIILVSLYNVILWSIITLLMAILLTTIEINNPSNFYLKLQHLPHTIKIASIIILIATTALMIIIAEFMKEKKYKELQQVRKELEHSQILSEVGEVSAGIAHEINNPLQIIRGVTELIAKKHPNIDQSYIRKINEQINRTQKIIQGLKKLSRNGSQDIKEKIDLYNEVTEVINLHRNRFNNSDMQLQLIPPSESLTVNCRSVQLNQIITNIINNAYDHLKTETPDQRWVKIEFISDEITVILRISNGGEKISSKLAKKIFTPFYTTKDVDKGTGLGLSLAKSLAQQNGGILSLNEQTNYTSFELSLPLLKE